MPKGGRKFRPFERFLGSFLLRDPMRKHSLCRRVVCLHVCAFGQTCNLPNVPYKYT